ncbi:putative kinase APK1B, partial [Trifolium pratense]
GLNYSKLDSREDDDVLSMLQTSTTFKCFTLKDIQTATRNAIPDKQEDDFCCVKGWINRHTLAPTKKDSGLEISVKKLNRVNHQKRSVWLRKINNMGQLSHPNLVKLIGYCLEDQYPILAYEFLVNGSLDNHLFNRSSNMKPLSWTVRMKIALDIAKGLAFLHSNEVEVIHGDIKTSNILIDSNYNAKLSDFGLEKIRDKFGEVNSSLTLYIAMSQPYRYIAPEYYITDAKNWPRCELGDKPERFHINQYMIFQLMDSYLEGQYSLHEAGVVAIIAIRCLSRDPKYRPKIDEVVSLLEQNIGF